jgi:large subunit ribosomal protein L25
LVLVHDLQLDPVKDVLIHVDFLALKKWEKVRAIVPVIVEWIEKLQKQWLEVNIVKDEIEVEAIPSKLPHDVKIDVSSLKDGENISVANLNLWDDVEIITHKEEAIVVVYNPSTNTEEETSEETEETATEE